MLFLFTAMAYCVENIVVKSIQVNEPFVFNAVYRIYQDSTGYLWFGSENGVCRYDGYRNLIFRSGLDTPNLLTNNEVSCFQETSNGYLIIGTQQGLNLLDKSNYRVTPFVTDGLDKRTIRCMERAKDGSIWIATDPFLYHFTSDLSTFKRYQSPVPNSHSSNFYEDSQGRVWLSLWYGGLYLFDEAKNGFISYPPIGQNNNPFKVFEDNRGQLWICTWGDGVYLFNPEKEEKYRPITFSEDPLKTENAFFSIVQDDVNEYVWIMSMAGLHALAYDSKGSLVQVDVHDLFNDYNNIFSEVVKGRDGNLWIASFGEGVLSVQFNRSEVDNWTLPVIKKNTGFTPHISAIYEDKDGLFWLQQDRHGLAFYDPKRASLQFYTEYPRLRNIQGLNRVTCLADFRSAPGEIWVGTENKESIYCFVKKGNEVVLSHEIDLSKIKTNAGAPRIFFEDKMSNVWIATTQKLFFKPYNSDSVYYFNYILNSITGITEDTRGDIWVSCKNSGLYRISSFNPLQAEHTQIACFSEKQGNFISNNIEAIYADVKGHVWISTKQGHLLKYDIVDQRITDLSQPLGMVGENVQDILSDDFGHIWITTNRRVFELNPENNASWTYSVEDGVVVDFFVNNSYLKSRSGKLYFGGNRGVSIFTPTSRLSKKTHDPKTFITDMKINNRSVFLNNDNDQFDLLHSRLTLDPEESNIEIYFSTLDYTYPSKIQYAYKMDGIDEYWVYPPENRQFAVYSQLSKGRHTFWVKATDEKRLWSDQITRFDIYKQPAFYESNWAYFIYFALFLLSSFFAFRVIRNRVRLRNQLKMAQIEKDKTEELTQTKLRYFTNISHDFLTPLTIISCLIDNVEELLPQKVSQFEMMRTNVNRLRRLLQQILDFRKLENGNMNLTLSYGDIVTFIKDTCYTNFLPLMNKKEIRFSFDANPVQIYAYFDADKIDKIIFNLLSNAFKYTPENGEVSIRLEYYVENEHPHLLVEVADTGVGIAPENLEHIFTRFYNNKTASAAETNGIGLSLTKDLVELHHGRIHVMSELNKGTKFVLSIPIDEASYNDIELGRAQEERIEQDTDKEPLPELSEGYEDIPTVLLVEDNEELLKLMTELLSSHYKILTAIHGVDALKKVMDNSVDILISDVMMPEMDGLELCRTLKSDLVTSHIPVILLTAKSSTRDRVDCYNAGADGYISKPFDLKVLEARINNFISTKKRKQQQFKADVEINISTLEYPSLDEEFLKEAVQLIEQNLTEYDFDINSFAEGLKMSKSSLYRKIKTMTGLSPIEFIRNIKLKHACRMLKQTSMTISEVAYASGFSDPKYFATCFRAEFGMTPRNYQKKITDKEE